MAKLVTYRCHTCGYASRLGRFFRREAGGLFGRPVQLCAGCAPYRSDRSTQKAVASVLIWTLISALFAFSYAGDFGTAGQGFAWFATAALSGPFNMAAHELGHAMAAGALGARVLKIRFGRGPRLSAIRIADVTLEWRRYPFLGGETTYVPPSAAFPSWKTALIALAGPLTNLILAAIFATLPSLFPNADLTLAAACSGLTLANLLMGVSNLFVWRRNATTDASATQSDGATILAAFGRRPLLEPEAREQFAAERLCVLEQHGEAADAYESLLSRRPGDTFYLCKALHLIDRARGPKAALAAYRRLVMQGPPQRRPWGLAPMESFLHGNLAWFALKLGDEAHLSEADVHAPRAMAHAGEAPEIQATMGALDVRRGRIEAGEALLLAGVRKALDPIDRADFCAFLTEASRARDDGAMAAQYQALGRRLLSQA
jgi:Zn-dependent protease